MLFGMRQLGPLSLSILVLFSACDDGSSASSGSPDGGDGLPDGGTGTDDGGATRTDGGADAGAGCEGIGCIDVGASIRKAVAYDRNQRPIVAYVSSDGIRVRRWSGTAWELLGAAIANRETLSHGFQLHVIGDKPTLVSGEGSSTGGRTHVQVFDGTNWNDVPGSPIALPELGSGDVYDFDSASRNDVLHVVMASSSGNDTFHVRKWDGTTLSAETEEAGAAGSKGVAPKIGVASDGTIATAYGRDPAYITKNTAGTTNWTLGTATANGYTSLDTYFSFVWTTNGGFMTRFDHAVFGRGRIFATKGDGQNPFVPAGSDDGLVESSEPYVGAPVLLTDTTDRVLVVVPFFKNGTDAATHVRTFDGTGWSAPVEGAPAIAGSVAPSTLAAATHDKVVGVVSESRLGSATPYLRYEELTLP